MAHRIRLRKPWTRHDSSVLSPCNADDFSEALRVDVPDQMTGDIPSTDSDKIHIAVYRRHFNCPSGLQIGTQVQLEIGEVIGRLVEARLNSAVIVGREDHAMLPAQWDITTRISASNELEIEIASGADTNVPPRLVGEVNLWIVDQG